MTYDLIVIGAGPGGYVAAIRGAQLGMTVAIIEKEKTLGGTCLNWGCIPSKALLDSSEHYHQAAHKFKVHGIEVTGLKVNIKQMMARKNDVVSSTTQGIDYLMKKNKIERILGTASFKDANTLLVTNGKTKTEHQAKKIIIATGSDVITLPSVAFDGKRIISSKEALDLTEIPKHLIVIGGGVIGVELGSVYARLGSQVTIIEYADRLLPTMDKELGKSLEKSLKSLGMTFQFNTQVTGAKVVKNKATVTAKIKTGEDIQIEADYVLVAVGRRAYTDGLALDVAGIKADERGRVETNEHFQTNIASVYAIGDVVKGPMLAHKASEEGVACVEYIAGLKTHLNYNTIPGVVYTWPEVASVGQSEEQLKEAGILYKIGKFPFKASGRARASEESEGFAKVLADAKTDEILGIHIIGPRASDMIGEAVVAMEYRASAEDIGSIIHAHPTFTEALKEAALAATDNRPIHI
ncbi:MAG: dihydrolipoyl dehydrogenase [Candidatus Margulisbacteria bacterium]|nr:dihydrolipoyl dehydrogenase [Candidatus Margulisiibacteriota bacterium]